MQRGGADERDPFTFRGRRELAQRRIAGEAAADRLGSPLLQVHPHQRRTAPAQPNRIDRIARRSPGVGPEPLDPSRPRIFGRLLYQRPQRSVRQVVEPEIEPAFPIGDEAQVAAVRGKSRLEDRDGTRRIAGHPHRFRSFSSRCSGADLPQVEGASVPRHVGVVPRDPGDPAAVRVPGRLHVEVASGRQLNRPAGAVGPGQTEAVDTLGGMHVDQPAPVRRGGRRRRPAPRRGHGHRFRVLQSVAKDPPAGDEKDLAAGNRKVAAAVSHAGSDGTFGDQVAGRPVEGFANHQDPRPGTVFPPDQASGCRPSDVARTDPRSPLAGRQRTLPESVREHLHSFIRGRHEPKRAPARGAPARQFS